MPEVTLQLIVLLTGVAVLTALATFWDVKERRIPNNLTLPVFFAGLIYQVVFNGLSGLGDAGLGFLVGFGTLFLLWMVGGGGGGDVKLMGALSVWLGYYHTMYVLMICIGLVLASTASVMVYQMLKFGPKRIKNKYLATGKSLPKGEAPKKETVAQKQGRRVMAFAVPVAIATWTVLLWKLPTLP